MTTPPHESLIRRVLGANLIELKLHQLAFEERDGGSLAKLSVLEGDQIVDVEGRGVGLVDAIYAGLLERYAREYQSLKTIELTGFQVSADLETKQAHGVDAIARAILDVTNSEGRVFSFSDASRSVATATVRAVLAMVSFFVNAERAFLTLHNARRDALSRGREDLVSRYTAEMAAVVESTSYAEVIANIRKELG